RRGTVTAAARAVDVVAAGCAARGPAAAVRPGGTNFSADLGEGLAPLDAVRRRAGSTGVAELHRSAWHDRFAAGAAACPEFPRGVLPTRAASRLSDHRPAERRDRGSTAGLTNVSARTDDDRERVARGDGDDEPDVSGPSTASGSGASVEARRVSGSAAET